MSKMTNSQKVKKYTSINQTETIIIIYIQRKIMFKLMK